MSRLTDPEILARYLQTLADWRLEGAIILKGRVPDGLRTTLEDVTEAYFKEALYHFVCEENGEIDQVKEERDPWRNYWEWHYDLRLTINGVKLYVETRLDPESFRSPPSPHDPDPTIQVVQIKPA